MAERLAAALEIPIEERTAFVRRARSTTHPDPSLTLRTLPLPLEISNSADLSGRTIKGYVLRERIGSGGFGAVYRAQQTGVARNVAVKIILPEYANHPEFIRRFGSEAQIVARLEHPHIVPLYDYWREPDGAYLVMRYMHGSNLQTALHRAPWTLDRVMRLLEQIGGALAFAHQLGVVHGDVKPTNILLDSDRNAYLTDFGIAKDLRTAEPDGMTQTGMFLGSPAYLSPEQIRDEPVTSQTDIYSLGIVLYELLAGALPFADLSPAERLAKHLNDPLPSLSTARPDVPSTFDSIIHQATAKRPADRYLSIVALLTDWQHATLTNDRQPTIVLSRTRGTVDDPDLIVPPSIVIDAASDSTTPVSSTVIKTPYKGLRAFGEADAADFFGRDALVERLLERLTEESPAARFLAVVGPSGSGKSSVVRAGLIPALRRGGLPASEKWFIAEIVPGAHPLDELELALLKLAAWQPAHLREQLDRDERGVARVARLIIPDDLESELLLVIDQFEELFTLVEDEAERGHFLNSIFAAVSDTRNRVRAIITLRADFYDRPLLYPGFAELMGQCTEVVPPLTPEELVQAIANPATRVGLRIEPGLTHVMVKDMRDQPGTLPLLQYALTELFERREDNTLTLSAYQSSGAVRDALVRRAEELYTSLDQQGQEAMRQLFLRMVTLSEGVVEDTRRRIRRAELATTGDRQTTTLAVDGRSSAVDAVIDLYGRYRLLTFDRDPITREPTVEIAHEVLIRTWGRLRAWLDASRNNLRVHRQLTIAAHEWVQSKHDPSFLASGRRLAQIDELAAASDLALNNEETAYLQASLNERDQREALEQERKDRELELARQSAMAQRSAANRLRYLVGTLALFLIIAIGLSVFAFNQQEAAVTNLTHSEAQRLAAEATTLLQSNGSAEIIGLLSIRSLTTQYSPQGDAVLAGASRLDYPRGLFFGHTDPINAVAFSPDGRYVLTGSTDKTLRLWNAQTNQEVRQFIGHTDAVEDVAFSPDGHIIASSSDDKTIRLWDVISGQQFHLLSGHKGIVYGVAFSPNGKYIVSGSQDGTARLWDVQSGHELRQFVGHTDQVTGVAFSPDGKQVLTGSYDKSARLWDVATGQEIQKFVGHTELIWNVAFSPDGQSILTAGFDKSARLWDVQSGRERVQFVGHSDVINGLAFSPNGKYVATGGQDQTARLWDAQTGKELRRFVGYNSFVWDVAFSPDGESLLTGSFDGTARIWNVVAQPPLPLLNDGSGVTGVTFSPDGKQILTGSFNNTARLWEAKTGTEIQTFKGHLGIVGRGAFSPDGKYVFTSSADKTARLWDARTGKQVRTFIGHTSIVRSVAFSPDGKYVLTGSDDDTARLWNVETGAQLHIFQHDHEVFAVAFSPDGNNVLTGAYDQTARLWDVQTGAQLRVFNIPKDGAAAVAFSPDGKQVLTGSWDGIARLWDVQTGEQLRSFVGHTDIIWSVAFSPDGKYVLTGSEDKTARLWDAQTGQELRRFAGHTATLLGVTFSPDGKYVLTGSLDGTARLWDVDYHDTIHYLCSRLLRDFTDAERAQYSITDKVPTCPKP